MFFVCLSGTCPHHLHISRRMCESIDVQWGRLHGFRKFQEKQLPSQRLARPAPFSQSLHLLDDCLKSHTHIRPPHIFHTSDYYDLIRTQESMDSSLSFSLVESDVMYMLLWSFLAHPVHLGHSMGRSSLDIGLDRRYGDGLAHWPACGSTSYRPRTLRHAASNGALLISVVSYDSEKIVSH